MPEECEFSVSDLHQDDFYMFRYELHTINKKHFYQDEKSSNVYLLGQNPLSNLNGVPVKELMKDLKKTDNYKYREQEREELMKKCQDIFNPPGIVHVTETAYKKQSNVHPDVKMAIPQDIIFKRLKMEQKMIALANTDAKNPAVNQQSNNKSNVTSNIRKMGAKPTDSSVLDKERLSALYKEYHLDLQLERENANNVNFE